MFSDILVLGQGTFLTGDGCLIVELRLKSWFIKLQIVLKAKYRL